MHMHDLCSHMYAHVCMCMQMFAYAGTCMPGPMDMHDTGIYCHLQAPTPTGGGVCMCMQMLAYAGIQAPTPTGGGGTLKI